jgi:uncharacterized protein (DUF1501 family)
MSNNASGVSRRVFMKSGALALATIGLNPSFLRRTVFAQDLLKGAALNGNTRGKVLIVLFQRGAADALNVVVPHGEAAYYKMRPNIAIPRPSALGAPAGAAQSAIDLDGFFGLHPSLSPFKRMWDDGILASVHAVGSPSNTRSHFDAQDYMESGTPDNKGTRDGWLNPVSRREGHVRRVPSGDNNRRMTRTWKVSPFQAVAMTPQTPRILEGNAATVAMNSLDEFTIRTNGTQGRADRRRSIAREARMSSTPPAARCSKR